MIFKWGHYDSGLRGSESLTKEVMRIKKTSPPPFFSMNIFLVLEWGVGKREMDKEISKLPRSGVLDWWSETWVWRRDEVCFLASD